MNSRRIIGGLILAALGFLAGTLTFYKNGAPPPSTSANPVATGPQNSPNQTTPAPTFAPGQADRWFADFLGKDPYPVDELKKIEMQSILINLSRTECLELLARPDMSNPGYSVGPWEGIILMRLAKLDPPAALEHVKKRMDGSREALAVVFARGVDSPGLDECIQAFGSSGTAGYAFGDALQIIAKNGGDAISLALKHPDLRIFGDGALIFSMTQYDPPGACEAAVKLRSGDNLALALDKWAAKDPAAAEAWARELPDISLRSVAMASFLKERLKTDLPAAASEYHDLLAELNKAGKSAPRPLLHGVESVASQFMTQQSAAEALAWCESLPPGSARASGFSCSVGIWLTKDPQAASEWATGLSNPLDRDAAASAIIEHALKNDRPAALQWAMTISEPKARERSVDYVLKEWRTADPEAAAAAEAALPANRPKQ